METPPPLTSDCRRSYSWWWDSHISPKNSKWLQENLTDMDSKIKAMIKLIEEDADSFARRAEMYYKKRPELMKLVEEFYRAYRALAERYDHATAELRQAHKTLAQTLDQDQISLFLSDYSPLKPSPEPLTPATPRRPYRRPSMDFQSRMKALNEFMDEMQIEPEIQPENPNLKMELSLAQKNSSSLEESAIKAETQARELKQELTKVEAERDSLILQQEHYLNKINNLESLLNQTEEKELLQKELNRVINERDETILRHEQCLQKITELEKKLDDASLQNAKLEELNQSLQLQAEDLTKKIMIKDHALIEKQEDLEKLQNCLQNEHARFKQVEIDLQNLQKLHCRSQDEQKVLTMDLKRGLTMLEDEQVEIVRLKEMKEKLGLELTLQIDQTGGLQKEITSLKDEILSMNMKYREVMEQLKSAGVSAKLLQDENSRLQRVQVEDMVQKCDLLKKIEENESVLEENATLVSEKASILSQMQMITENMQKLIKDNTILQNSLSAAHTELSQLRVKSNDLEELNKFLSNEKSKLITERGQLVEQLEKVEGKLENLETRFTDLENVKEEGSTGTRLASLESNIEKLRDESRRAKKDFEEELGRAVNAQLEIFVLQKFVQDLEHKNYALILECQKHTEASKLAEKLISELENENLEQQVEGEILLDEIGKLRLGIYKVFRALDVDEHEAEEEGDDFLHVLRRIKDLKKGLENHEDQTQYLSIENSILMTLIRQVKLDERERAELEIVAMKNELEKKDLEILFLKEELATKNAAAAAAAAAAADDDNWSLELKEMSNEFEMWEAEAATFYFDLQLSNVREVLYESKVQELSETCQALESESASKAVEIHRMKERVGLMENEIGGLKAQLSAFTYKEDGTAFEEDEEEDVSELQRLQYRVEAVEKAVILKQDEERRKPEIHEESPTRNGNLTKDIPLDKISNASNSLHGRKTSTKRNSRTDDQMLELWENAAQDSSTFKQHIPPQKNVIKHSLQFDKSKISEALAKDSEKLAKLKMTMMELKRKLEEEKSKKKKRKSSFDIETVKEQLQEVDEAIVQFTSLNGQMKRNVEENAHEGEKGLRVYQLVRKGSESVARLEVEVQKIHYVLLKKEEDEKKISKGGGIRFSKNKTNIILKSLLINTNGRQNISSPRQKKHSFCGCFNPSTPSTAARISM